METEEFLKALNNLTKKFNKVKRNLLNQIIKLEEFIFEIEYIKQAMEKGTEDLEEVKESLNEGLLTLKQAVKDMKDI